MQRIMWTVLAGAVFHAPFVFQAGAAASHQSTPVTLPDYRRPDPSITALLTATPPPQPIVHTGSGQVALLFHEAVIEMERLARLRLGLGGYRFDPTTGISGTPPLVQYVEIIAIGGQAGKSPVRWQPAGDTLLEDVRFSPDGRWLSATAVSDGPAQLALFEIETNREHRLDIAVNAAWGEPCGWVTDDTLVCRLLRKDRGRPPLPRPAPTLINHPGGPAPTRTYANLLENTYEDELFEFYFGSDVAQVSLRGKVRRVPGLTGMIAGVEPAPDGTHAVVTRIHRPYSRLVPARRFPTTLELWDLRTGTRLYATIPRGFGLENDVDESRQIRRATWKPGLPPTLGYIEEMRTADGRRLNRWLELAAPFAGEPRERARSEKPFRNFGWTTAGTPWFTVPTDEAAGVSVNVVFDDGVREIWRGITTDSYGNPGTALRQNGSTGPVVEVNGRIFLAGDGLSDEGPRPFLDRLDLRSGETRRLYEAEPGVFEVVLALLDPEQPAFVTSRETETEPPNLYVRRGEYPSALRAYADPYPQLTNVTRRVLRYRRKDGLALSGTLYLPESHRPGEALPTLVWIYPYEFVDREHAEQLDVRAFRFHRVKGPSPLAAVLAGYAVLLNPTVPILHEAGAVNDDYLAQLVASIDAAVDHLVATGVSDPARIAVAGRSYGAFSSANLLIHSDRFATAIALSGAYNRTLTPFGFQREKRSFWEATSLYANISPFFHANEIDAPILLVHGGADDNPGTPPLQARRFFHALVGEGVTTRYLELPWEGHHYRARENVLLAAAEMLDWLDKTIGTRTHAENGP